MTLKSPARKPSGTGMGMGMGVGMGVGDMYDVNLRRESVWSLLATHPLSEPPGGMRPADQPLRDVQAARIGQSRNRAAALDPKSDAFAVGVTNQNRERPTGLDLIWLDVQVRRRSALPTYQRRAKRSPRSVVNPTAAAESVDL